MKDLLIIVVLCTLVLVQSGNADTPEVAGYNEPNLHTQFEEDANDDSAKLEANYTFQNSRQQNVSHFNSQSRK